MERMLCLHLLGQGSRGQTPYPAERYQCVVSVMASASDLIPGTMLLVSGVFFQSMRKCSSAAPTATAGMLMAMAMLASVEPTSARTISGEPGLREKVRCREGGLNHRLLQPSPCGRALE